MKDCDRKFISTLLAVVIAILLSVALMRVFDLLTEINLMMLAWCYSVLGLYLFFRMTRIEGEEKDPELLKEDDDSGK